MIREVFYRPDQRLGAEPGALMPRFAWVRVPEGWDTASGRRPSHKPWPLCVVLHGGGIPQNAGATFNAVITALTLGQHADAENYLLVFPEAHAGPSENQAWNDGRGLSLFESMRQDFDDVGFLGDVLTRLQKRYNGDPERTYVCGFSNGAMMVYRLSHDAPFCARVAAFGAFCSGLPTNLEADQVLVPRPMMLYQGTGDLLMPHGGGSLVIGGQDHGSVLSHAATTSWHRAKLGAMFDAQVTIPNLYTTDQTSSSYGTYSGGLNDSEIWDVTVINGGHAWANLTPPVPPVPPAGGQYYDHTVIGRCPKDFDLAALWLAFTKRARIAMPAA